MKQIRCAAAVAITAAVVWVGCSNPNLAGGKLHFDQKRYDRALETFKLARQQMPASGEARMWLGRAFAELERADSTSNTTEKADSAAANFDLAIKLDPRIQKMVEDVRGHYWSERFAAGITSAKAAQENTDSGDKSGAQRNYRTGLNYFKKAFVYANEKDRKQTLENLGKMYFNLNRVDSALTIFNTVREMAPEDPATKAILYNVYFGQGQKLYQDAADAMEKRTSADSTVARSAFTQALALYAQASEVVSEDPKEQSDLLFQRGSAAYELAYLDKAQEKEYLQKAADFYAGVLKLTTDDVDVMYNLALVYKDLEQYQNGRDWARKLVDTKPSDGTYHELLGIMEDKLGNKNARLQGIIFGRALRNGTQVAVADARARSEKHGPTSDIARRFRENGQPDELRTFTDSSNNEWECWFYWVRGTGFAFVGGSQRYDTKFAAQK
ncbi:MAG: tetratricopeptide repeat protein [Candidatus Eisenbacteria bacterium]|nr:tetratricopeptide repeat protein [Candidatus Eisenbacteria bacterium]